MSSRNELAWAIVCHLYRDEEEDVHAISSALSAHKPEVNSILYDFRNLFTKRTSPYSARPLWKLTTEGVEDYDMVYKEIKNHIFPHQIAPLFCESCNTLYPLHSPNCEKFSLGKMEKTIPSKVNSWTELSLPRFFEIEYSGKDGDIEVSNRREIMLDFLITTFKPVESNSLYVDSYHNPRTKERRAALVNHLQGINVPATPMIQQLRNNDIDWLINLDIDDDLP